MKSEAEVKEGKRHGRYREYHEMCIRDRQDIHAQKNNEMINSINIQIRETNTDDFDSIMTVEKQAFGYDKEASTKKRIGTNLKAPRRGMCSTRG